MNLVERYRRARPRGAHLVLGGRRRARTSRTASPWASRPITTCTDLLRPGGYGRLPRYDVLLAERMRAVGAPRIGDFVVRAFGKGEEAVRAEAPDGPVRDALAGRAWRSGGDIREAAGDPGLYDRIVARGRRPQHSAGGVARRRRAALPGGEEPRGARARSDRTSSLFDCINCDKCIPVCPNDANFVYETARPDAWTTSGFVVRGGCGGDGARAAGSSRARRIRSRTSRTSATSAATATSSARRTADPTSRSRASSDRSRPGRRLRERDGFFARGGDGRGRGLGAHPRPWSTISRWTARRDRGVFTDGVITVEVSHRERRPLEAQRARGRARRPRPRLLGLPQHGPGRATACSTPAAPTPSTRRSRSRQRRARTRLAAVRCEGGSKGGSRTPTSAWCVSAPPC